MKKYALLIMIFLSINPQVIFAKFSKHQTVILLQSDESKEAVGSIVKLLPRNDTNANRINIVGKLRIITVPRNPTITQIVWTGVCFKDDKTQRVAFDKPMTSIFKGDKSALNKKPKLLIEGDEEILKAAIIQLEKGIIDKENLKKKQVAKNPIHQGRYLLAKNSNDTVDRQTQTKITSNNELANDGQSNLKRDSNISRKPQNSVKNIHASKQSTKNKSKANNIDSNNIGLNDGFASDSNATQNNQISRRVRTQDSAQPVSTSTNNVIVPNQGLNASTLLRHIPSGQRPEVATQNASVGGGLSLTPGIASIAPGQNGITSSTGDSSQRAISVSQRANSNSTDQTAENTQQNQQGGQNSQFNLGEAQRAPQQLEEQQQAEPEVSYQVTEEGCRPRVDRVHERVIIQNRTKRFENGTLREEGECTDSLEIYPIMRDFLCENCTDVVNADERRAYSRFQEFWFDRENHKQVLGDSIYPDLGRPYNFVDESGGCEPLVNIEAGTVHRQVETVYYNFNNTRVVAQVCHQAPNQNPIMIQETADGCRFSHDYVRNESHAQKKSIYILDGVTREVLPCHPVGNAIPHEFFASDCQAVTNLANNTVTNMVKRRIRTATGYKIISRECEPEQSSNLLSTASECQGQYYHDITNGRSYLKKVYYYNQNGAPRYVSPCIRTNEFIAHQSEIKGWVNNDNTRISRPSIEYFIQTPSQGKVIVDTAKVREDLGALQYTYLRNEHRSNGSVYFEGCYRRTRTNSINIYRRGDGSIYERNIGAGNIIASNVNECSSRVESRTVQLRHRGGNFFRDEKNWYGLQERIITGYPNGSEVASGWYDTGQTWHD